jgi:hypothetical protein
VRLGQRLKRLTAVSSVIGSRTRRHARVKGAYDSFVVCASPAIIALHRPREVATDCDEAEMGEKGNVVDPGLAVIATGPSVIERTSSVVTSTVVQGAETLRSKVIGAGADVALDEARDRIKAARTSAEDMSEDLVDPELPPSATPSSPS